ncbi:MULTISPECIES: hypothetical protein [Haloferax]|uniref:Uncharacterized protein n=1 Tax=Haloferax marinum TaxID=2666143 RepID=A0A6A8G8W0_9EURY|nr:MULTISPECIES: hypothetical protein [Haloferax]KAB1198502.1 hypothetical protein Hfx1150_13655 [Haloferax sp. CBA1150]MRW97609.1 hypothetical protein [Haloferax marinum]
MEPLGIEQTVERIAETYEIEVYDVHESDDTLVIEQDEFDETRFAMTSALIFDRYDTQFDTIEVRVSESGETREVDRRQLQESFDRLSNVVGN